MSQTSDTNSKANSRNDVLREYVHRHFKGLGIPRWYFLHVAAVILKTKVRRLAEIGVNKGKTSYHLRRLFFQAELHLVDPWTPYEEDPSNCIPTREVGQEKYRRVQALFDGDDAVTLHRMMSEEAARKIPGDFDVVFIDANHDYQYVKKDISLWRPRIRPGGFLAGHDYLLRPGVREGVNELLPGAFCPEEWLWGDVWVYAE